MVNYLIQKVTNTGRAISEAMWTIKTQINYYSRESAIGILSAGVAHLEQNRHPAYFSQGRISKGILLSFFQHSTTFQ